MRKCRSTPVQRMLGLLIVAFVRLLERTADMGIVVGRAQRHIQQFDTPFAEAGDGLLHFAQIFASGSAASTPQPYG